MGIGRTVVQETSQEDLVVDLEDFFLLSVTCDRARLGYRRRAFRVRLPSVSRSAYGASDYSSRWLSGAASTRTDSHDKIVEAPGGAARELPRALRSPILGVTWNQTCCRRRVHLHTTRERIHSRLVEPQGRIAAHDPRAFTNRTSVFTMNRTITILCALRISFRYEFC
jgi:hypothetical protein